MTIDEAIALVNIENECINRAENCNRKCNECELIQDTDTLLDLYKQLAEWLEELKALKHNAHQWAKAGYAHGHSVGYNKSIDDLREKLMQSGFIFTQHALNVFDEIAEQLKAGEKNE